MNTKHRKTLDDIFHNPMKSSVIWSDIEGLFRSCGAVIEEGSGSRVCVMLNDIVAVFHRPHPRKETNKGALKSVRRFLESAGVVGK